MTLKSALSEGTYDPFMCSLKIEYTMMKAQNLRDSGRRHAAGTTAAQEKR